MKLEMIAFDADDTLWHSESYYHDAQNAFADMLAPYGVEKETAFEVLHRVDISNLPAFGYGIKGFIISMVEAAVEATGGRIHAEAIQKIVGLGREMTRHEIRLLDHSAETVALLAKDYPLMLITKGDLMDQERKLADSGLESSFQQVEIVSDKTSGVYAALLRRHGLAAERFLMVGNSMRSDILPVLELGGQAVHVPYALTWIHESGTAPVSANGRFHEIEHLGLLPELVKQIEQRD